MRLSVPSGSILPLKSVAARAANRRIVMRRLLLADKLPIGGVDPVLDTVEGAKSRYI